MASLSNPKSTMTRTPPNRDFVSRTMAVQMYSGRHLMIEGSGFESWPGACFSKAPETFRVRKAIAKSQTLRLQSCLIHIFLMGTEILFIQGVSAVYTSSFLDTDELKIALRARKVSGTFEKRAIVLCPWLQYTFRAPLQVSRVKSLSPYIKLKLIELAIKLYQEF